MNKKDLHDAFETLSPDQPTSERMLTGLQNQPPRAARKPLRWALPACAALVLVTSLFVWQPWSQAELPLDNAPVSGVSDPTQQTPPTASNTDGLAVADLRGLPASDYTWTEGDGVAFSRIAFSSLYDICSYYNNYGMEGDIVVAKVLSAESFNNDGDGVMTVERQRAVIQVLYGLDNQLPEELTIVQNKAGGCVGTELTNLVRVGGIYVLPLSRYPDGEEEYYVSGDLDALFEVDDQGLLHSHSLFEDLNRYDGQPLTALWDDITYLHEHPALTSKLVQSLRWYAESDSETYAIRLGTVTGEAGESEFGYPRYAVTVTETLFGAPAETFEFNTEDWTGPLEIGQTYVFCGTSAARLSDDGTLTPVLGPDALAQWNDLSLVAGRTTDDLRADIAEICAYYGIE